MKIDPVAPVTPEDLGGRKLRGQIHRIAAATGTSIIALQGVALAAADGKQPYRQLGGGWPHSWARNDRGYRDDDCHHRCVPAQEVWQAKGFVRGREARAVVDRFPPSGALRSAPMSMNPSPPASGEVALIAMPFGGIHAPSLDLSLLRAELERVNVSCDVHYFNLDFAERIGIAQYDRYADNSDGASLGEWRFSDCLFPRPEKEGERFVEEVLIPLERFTLEGIEQFERERALAGPFLADCLRARDWSRYRVIGFTTTFAQNTPSLAFARMIKQVAPGSAIVFGGANCEGEMGLQLRRSFPWIDFVCTGEGDEVFPELARQLLGRSPRAPLPGIASDGHDPPSPARMVTDLDRLPHPDFLAYFDRVEHSPLRERLSPWIPMETSRGCWWGEKHHCKFCGLNGQSM